VRASDFRSSPEKLTFACTAISDAVGPTRRHQLPYSIHVPPDVTAQIFWLKNRDPKRWRDAWQVDAAVGKYVISERPLTEDEWIKASGATVIDVTPEK
jgi:hypothetical protein